MPQEFSSIRSEKETVKLAHYKPEHRAALERFQLPEEKKQFTGMPAEVLPAAIEDKLKHPIVILAQQIPVGFFVLDEGNDVARLTSRPKAVLLRAFSINEEEQGKGYATRGLQQLADFAREMIPDAQLVVLAVNARNTAARSLYLKCGFEDHGSTKMGPHGPQHVLSLRLKKNRPIKAGKFPLLDNFKA